jgi:undecaprenyl-diphosphatase
MGSSLPPPESPEMILFDLIVHVGTLVSIAIVFWGSLRYLAIRTFVDLAAYARAPGGWGAVGPVLRLMILGATTVFVTGVLGLVFKDRIELVFGAPQIVAITLATTGLLLWLTDRLGPRPVGLKSIGFKIAIIIGIAQAAALVPGISRSGITIIAGLFAGLKRRWAAEYSFLIAIPTILAATVVQGLREVEPAPSPRSAMRRSGRFRRFGGGRHDRAQAGAGPALQLKIFRSISYGAWRWDFSSSRPSSFAM